MVKIMERTVTLTSWTLWTQLADSDSPDPKLYQVGLATGRSGLLTNDTLHDIVALPFAAWKSCRGQTDNSHAVNFRGNKFRSKQGSAFPFFL